MMTLDQITHLELRDITIFQMFDTTSVAAENFHYLYGSLDTDKKRELLKLLMQTVYLSGLMAGLKAMEKEKDV